MLSLLYQTFLYHFSASAKPTLAEQALAAGRSYVIMPKRDPSKKSKKPVDLSRIDDIERFLYKEPNQLQRSQSFYNMRKGEVHEHICSVALQDSQIIQQLESRGLAIDNS